VHDLVSALFSVKLHFLDAFFVFHFRDVFFVSCFLFGADFSRADVQHTVLLDHQRGEMRSNMNDQYE